jgi:hypothetical protein
MKKREKRIRFSLLLSCDKIKLHHITKINHMINSAGHKLLAGFPGFLLVYDFQCYVYG